MAMTNTQQGTTSHSVPTERGDIAIFILREMRASGSWHAATLDRAIEAISSAFASTEGNDNQIIAQCALAVEAMECPFQDGLRSDGWGDAWATAINRIQGLAVPSADSGAAQKPTEKTVRVSGALSQE